MNNNNNQKGTDMEKFIVIEHHTDDVTVTRDAWGYFCVTDKNGERVPVIDYYKDLREATRHAQELISDGKTAKVISSKKKGTDMKTFLVKFTGSNEWIQMQATSKFELAERLRQEGKSGSIKSPENIS